MKYIIVVTAVLLMAASAQAQTTVWSAEFTPDTDGYDVGCDNGGGYAECSAALKNDTFTVGDIVYTVTELYLTQGGTNRLYFAGTRTPADGTAWADIADALTIGSTSLNIVDATKTEPRGNPDENPHNNRVNWRLRWAGDQYEGFEDLVSLPDDGTTSIRVTLISGEGAEPDPIPPPPLTCEEGEEVENGVCVPVPPPPLTCEEGEEVENGVCVPVPPPPLTCEEGEEVENGVCVPVPPPPLTCEEGEEVENGVCVPVPPPPLTCEEGEEVENGVCVPVPPPPLTCEEGEEVENGVCVPVPPPPLTCEEGEEVENGVCVPVPPPPLTCEEGEEVENGVCVPAGVDCDDCPPPPTPTPTPTLPEAAVVCLGLILIGAGARQLRRRVA